MAIFDPIEQRMCVRIVYDGTAGTGKTTNLRMLCGLFATQRKTELYSPGEVDGRTLLFDWVQILAGSVCGFPLMCQVISVPGQVVLTPRRRHLLASADVVVFVSDSAEAGIERARAALAVLRDIHGAKPLVLQANKQDQEDAISGSALAERLDLGGTAVVEAIASEGIGVVDTFVHAVRSVSRAMQSFNERGALHLEVKRAPGAADLLATMERQAVDPEWAAEMFLEEALTALLVESHGPALEPTPAIAAPSPSVAVEVPPRPTADVPTGFIWPAHTGREKLRHLAEHGALHAPFGVDDEGRASLRVLDNVLRTSRELRFVGREEARQALIRAARERTQLGSLLVPDTVLVAQPAEGDAWWLWCIDTQLTTVAEVLARRGESDRAILEAYAVGVVDALRASLRHGFTLDLGPTSFGVHGGVVRYVGDVRSVAPTEAALSGAMTAAAAALDAFDSAASTFLDAFGRELRRRLTGDEVARTAAALRSSGRGMSPASARLEALLAPAVEA